MDIIASFNIQQMERDILEAAHTLGSITYFAGSPTPALKVLIEKYSLEEDIEQLTVVVSHLLEERYLFPYFDIKGYEQRIDARGITPKGYRRLQELRHPIRSWVGANWFAVAVAAITAIIGISSVVTNLVVNLD